MKKTFASATTLLGLLSPAVAGEAYIHAGDNGKGMDFQFKNVSQEQCLAKGQELANAVIEWTGVHVICIPDKSDLETQPELQQQGYYCLRTEGPVICSPK